MKCGMAPHRWRSRLAPLFVAQIVTFLGGCTGAGTSAGPQAAFESELIAAAKKAKNRKEFDRLIDEKRKERNGFVASPKTVKKTRKR